MRSDVAQRGEVVSVSGPLVIGRLPDAMMGGQAVVGKDRVIGEVIRIAGELTTVQMYEATDLLQPGDSMESSGGLLSVELGPGLLGTVFDGIQRPLATIRETTGDRVRRGVSPPALDRQRRWHVEPQLRMGQVLSGGEVLGIVQETSLLQHRVLVPPDVSGELVALAEEGDYCVEDVIGRVRGDSEEFELRLFHRWPVRTDRPIKQRRVPRLPLITGQRVLDMLFPLAKGGTAGVPGPFGAGKTIVQHQLARWCDAEVIVFVGCGERGNEMVDLLEQFAQLTDPHSGRPLMERSVLIANTSNMPVTAREASIYTGITIAEYFRDQGFHVALMADSTSRWAEALREVAGRLEELPAEEGYPAYLGSRLAAFYERAGHVDTLCGEDGSVTLIGSVSPPGGDFSEPVTRHTQDVAGAFWALSKTLADARHYPAIDWSDSYSRYAEAVSGWWDEMFQHKWTAAREQKLRLLHSDSQQAESWTAIPRRAFGLLREADELKNIASIIGPTALTQQQQWTYAAANLVKEAFLQQNALDEIDTFCAPEKQIFLATLMMDIYRRGKELIDAGVECAQLLQMPILAKVKRARTQIPNDREDLLQQLSDAVDQALQELASSAP